MEALKNKLTAAVAMSAAALIASGYAITWARLDRVKAPPRAVLPALSTGYYLGVALEALLFLLLFLFTVSAVFLAAQLREGTREAINKWPSSGAWLTLGMVAAASGVVYGGAPTSGVFAGGAESSYPFVVVGLAAGTILLALAIGRAGRMLDLGGPIAISAAVLLLCTAAAVGFKVADARFGAIAFPQGAALTSETSCHTPDAEQVPGGCGFGGFYVGEDSNWVYFVQTPLICPGAAEEPGRLLQVRRDETFDVVVSEHLPTKPLKCTTSVDQGGPWEPEEAIKKQGYSKQGGGNGTDGGLPDKGTPQSSGKKGRTGTEGKHGQGNPPNAKGGNGAGGEGGQDHPQRRPLPMPERD